MNDAENVQKPRATVNMTTKGGYGVLMTITLGMKNDEIVELLEMVDLVDTKAKEMGFTAQTGKSYGTQTKISTAPKDLGVCDKCGAPNKWSEKKQKTYCSALCWQNQRTY